MDGAERKIGVISISRATFSRGGKILRSFFLEFRAYKFIPDARKLEISKSNPR